MSSLRGFEDIPIKYRPIFSPIINFNHVQSEVLDDVLKTSKFKLSYAWLVFESNYISNSHSERDIVVSSPTGSGKTAIFELAIVELLISLEQTYCDTNDVKIVYGTCHS